VRGTYPYDAFISYAHAETGELAASLQRWLERFATPWYKPRSLRVFRDYTSLTASSDLTGSITVALAESAHFVLLASPESAASTWVGREVEWWRRHRRNEDVLIVLTGGELRWDDASGDWDLTRSTALPPAARGMFTGEPLWVDLTGVEASARPDRSDPDLLHKVARLAAPLRGVDKDTLVGEHLTLHRRAVRQRRGGMAALCVLLVAALAGLYVADRQRRVADDERLAAAGRKLVADAAARENHPATAMMLGIAAMALAPTPAARANLLQTMTETLYAGTLRGHDAALTDVAFGPDSRRLITSSTDGKVAIWDVARAAHPVSRATFAAMDGEITGTAVSADGRTLVAGSAAETATVWDVGAAVPAKRATLRPGWPVLDVGISPDGTSVATGGPAGWVVLWDVTDPDRPRRTAGLNIDSGSVTVLTFSPDGHTVAIAGNEIHASNDGADDHAAVLWDITDRRKPRRTAVLKGHDGVVTSVAFDRTGTRVVTGGDDWDAIVWDRTDPGRPVRKQKLVNHNGTVTGAAFSPDGRRIVTSGSDRIAILWERSKTGQYQGVTAMRNHDGAVTAVAISPDGRTVATAGADRAALLWGADYRGRPARLAQVPGTTGEVIAFDPGGGTLVADDTGSTNTTALWDVADRARPRRRATLISGHLSAAAFAGDGVLATGSFLGPTTLWSPTGASLSVLEPVHANGAHSLAFRPDGHILAIGSEATVVPGTEIWDVADRARPIKLASLSAQTDGRVAVAFSPDGRTLATGSAGGTTILWDMRDPARPAQRAVLAGHTGAVNDLAFAPDGLLATAGDDGATMIWDPHDPAHPERVASLAEHTARVNAVRYSPDGGLLATGSADTRTILWSVTDRDHPVGLDALRGDNGTWTLRFSPDGRTLATGDGGGTLTLWDVTEMSRLVSGTRAQACAVTGRGLDRAEWARYVPELPYRPTCPS
jgi:WD40 repeat protein